jgi:hypothetical protein
MSARARTHESRPHGNPGLLSAKIPRWRAKVHVPGLRIGAKNELMHGSENACLYNAYLSRHFRFIEGNSGLERRI